VARPVDVAYQSLDVKVPVAIDGRAVDASAAPIVLDITVGGYHSVNNAQGGGAMGMMPPGMPPPGLEGGPPPMGQAGAPAVPAGEGRGGQRSFTGGNGSRVDLALLAGYVVVTPGARGWDNQSADGRYFGKAPAAIVDLKAAVRYVRHNAGRLPGNPQWIVSAGCSAGGGLSALLGASGNSPLYEAELRAVGAADAPDHVFASACYSPITDLEHADMSYEWMYQGVVTRRVKVDETVSRELAAAFPAHQDSLGLQGRAGFGPVTGGRLASYMLQSYTQPSATAYLRTLGQAEREAYLVANPWIRWDGQQARFSFADYTAHVGPKKGAPSFDSLTLGNPENRLFGTATVDARHFTPYSLRRASGQADAELEPGLRQLVDMMNPMYFVAQQHPGMAAHWWLRNGSSDSDNAQSVMINLATGLENRGRDVNAALFWDGGHCADDDPQGMVDWIAQITGYRRPGR